MYLLFNFINLCPAELNKSFPLKIKAALTPTIIIDIILIIFKFSKVKLNWLNSIYFMVTLAICIITSKMMESKIYSLFLKLTAFSFTFKHITHNFLCYSIHYNTV